MKKKIKTSRIQRFSKRIYEHELDTQPTLYFHYLRTWGKRDSTNHGLKSQTVFTGFDHEYALKNLGIKRILNSKDKNSYSKILNETGLITGTKVYNGRKYQYEWIMKLEDVKSKWYKCPEQTLFLDLPTSLKCALVRCWAIRNNESFILKNKINLNRLIQLACRNNGKAISDRQARKIKASLIKHKFIIQHSDDSFELLKHDSYNLTEEQWNSIPSQNKVKSLKIEPPKVKIEPIELSKVKIEQPVKPLPAKIQSFEDILSADLLKIRERYKEKLKASLSSI